MLIGYYLIAFIIFCTGVLFLILYFKFSRDLHKNTDWPKLTAGAWIVGALPYMVIKLLILALGVFLIYMSIGYYYNVILNG